MSIADEIRKAERAAYDAAWKVYVPLAQNDATGALNAGEKSKLLAAIKTLGFNAERVEADADIFRQQLKLKADAGPLDEAEQAAKAIRDIGDAFDAECRGVLVDLDERRRAIRERAIAAGQKVASAKRAQGALDELSRKHWQLLGAVDPAIAAKRRHLVQVIYGRPAAGECEMVEFEQLMQPNWGSVRSFEWVPLGDQPNLPSLVNEAEEIQKSGKRALYVSDDPQGEGKLARKGEIIFINSGLNFEHSFKVENYYWPCLPGQTPEQRDALLASLSKRLAKEARQRRDAEIVGRSGASVSYVEERYVDQR